MVREFESYYEFKLGRKPKLLRRRDGASGLDENAPPPAPPKRGGRRASGKESEPRSVSAPAQGSGAAVGCLKGRDAGKDYTPEGMNSAALGVMNKKLGAAENGNGGTGGGGKPVWLANGGAAGGGAGGGESADGGDLGGGFGVAGTKVEVKSRNEPKPAADGWGSAEERLLKPLPNWDAEVRTWSEPERARRTTS